MRHLIDTYIRADESKKVSAFDDISLVQLLVERGTDALQALPQALASSERAMAETIENNLRKVITDERPTNPMYYDSMSALLDTLIQQRQSQAKDYQAYLASIVELANKVQNLASGSAYPQALTTRARRALYDNLGKDERLALALDAAILRTKKDSWRGNMMKEKEVRYAIRALLPDEAETNRLLEIVKKQDEY